MKEYTKRTRTHVIAPLLIFTLFTSCLLFVLLSGANIYKTHTNNEKINFENRTLTQFLSTKIKQNDCADSIKTGSFDKALSTDIGDTLHIIQNIDGTDYSTRIYCYEGYLCELFTEMSDDFHPADGTQIMPMESITYTVSNNLLTIDITCANSNKQTLVLYIRSLLETNNEK